MSTDANAALAWPIEITEFAYIGDQVAHDLDQPDLFESPIKDRHFGTLIWGLNADERPALELLGTEVPGGIHFNYPDEVDARTGIQFDYPEAGMWWSFVAMAWRCRPFTGDPLGDPLVHQEGTQTGMWAITSEGQFLHASPAWVENHEAPMGGTGVYLSPLAPGALEEYAKQPEEAP
jgi:hypothetical protein